MAKQTNPKEVKSNPGRPRLYSPFELSAAIEDYFIKCSNHTVQVPTQKGDIVDVLKPRVPSVEGLCNHLSIHRDTWNAWGKEDLFSDIIKNASDKMKNSKVDALLNGDGNITGLIFYLKAKESWADKQTIEHQGDVNVTLKLDS